MLTLGLCCCWPAAPRCCVYDPVMQGRLVARPLVPSTKAGLARRAAAMFATMAVSGAAHELIFAYIAPIPSTGKWLAFFLLQVSSRLCA